MLATQATLQTQLSNKADKDTTYTKDQAYVQMDLRIDLNNAVLSGQYATKADPILTGLLIANAVSVTNGMVVSGNTTFGGPVTATSTLGVSGSVQAPHAEIPRDHHKRQASHKKQHGIRGGTVLQRLQLKVQREH